MWNSVEVQLWLEACNEEQQEFSDFLGTSEWTRYTIRDYQHLKKNLGFAIFGPPQEEADGSNEYTGYDKKQLKLINQIFEVLKKNQGLYLHELYVSFIFVSCKSKKSTFNCAVVRTHKGDGAHLFIDSCARVYNGWSDYLRNNKLPNCLIVYPRNGVYPTSGPVMLERGVSPAGSVRSKVAMALDFTTSGLLLGSGCVGITSLFIPVLLPVTAAAIGVAAVTGLYQSGRSIATLRDRDVHQESIGLDSPEARNCYLGIVGNTLGIAAGGSSVAFTAAAQTGRTIGVAGAIAARSISGVSCAINGLGVVNSVANIAQRAVQSNDVSSLDILQLTASVLFFTNSVMSAQQVRVLFNNVKSSDDSGAGLMRNMLRKFTGRMDTGVGEIVTWSAPLIAPNISVPMLKTFTDVTESIWKALVEVTKSLKKHLITLVEYKKKVQGLLAKLWQSYKEEIEATVHKICEIMGKKHWAQPVMEGFKCSAGLENNFLQEMAKTAIHQTKEFQQKLRPGENQSATIDGFLQATIKASQQRFGLDDKERAPFFEFACSYVTAEFEKHKRDYEKVLQMARKWSRVSDQEFDEEYGIRDMTHDQFFLHKTVGELNHDGFFSLELAYEIHKKKGPTTEHNIKLHKGVFFDTFHDVEGEQLSTDQYKQLVRKVCQEPVDCIEQDTNGAVIYLAGKQKIVLVQCFPEGGKVSGIVAHLNNAD